MTARKIKCINTPYFFFFFFFFFFCNLIDNSALQNSASKKDFGWDLNSNLTDAPAPLKQWNTNVCEQKRNCSRRGSNTGPSDLQSDALPTELRKHSNE